MAIGALITDYLQHGSGAPSGAPSIPNADWCFYQDDASGTVYYWDLNATDWVAIAGASAEYPHRATIWHDQAIVTAGNALLRVHDTAQNYGTYSVQNTPANGDTYTHSFLLAGGSYTLASFGVTYSSSGKVDVYVDNVLQNSGEDWYSGATAYNTVKTQSITVVGDGYHVLKVVVNGKNASSSNYNHGISKFEIYPSAD